MSKPNKYQVELFIVADSSEGYHFISYLDIYQGKNQSNFGIPKSIPHLPTTQKAVINIIMQFCIQNDPKGMQILYADNQYTYAKLAITVQENHGILICQTNCTNHKG